MAFLSVNNIPCGAPSSITLPLTGRPWAEVCLATQPSRLPFGVGDQVQVEIQDGETYTMTVERLGPRGGFSQARLICGTGGLGKQVEPKWYEGVTASTVVKELLQECGEAVGELDLPGPLPQWVRAGGLAHEALHALMMCFPERVWAVSPDGKVNAGEPLWPPHKKRANVESSDPATGTWTVAFDGSLTAGKHLTLIRGEEEFGKRITRVTHRIDEQHAYPKPRVMLRTILGTGDGEDQGVTGFEAVARRAMRWVDYLALFDCVVVRDHGDHTLDLRPSNPMLPEMTRVRLVQPIAGARVKLKAGGVVLLSFQAGDPSRPVVLHYGNATLERLELITGQGQMIQLDDDRGEVSPEDQRYMQPHVRLQDKSGQSIELWAQDGAERIRVQDKAGQSVTLNPVGNTISITANTTISITAATTVDIVAATVNVNGGVVNLAGGGPPVGRVGDMVQVSGVMPGGATVTGTIISGSPRVGSG